MIGSIGSNTNFSQLFSRLDTTGKGYLELEDLANALSQIATDSSGTAAADVFAAFDSNDDGKVTETEFSSTLTQLEETLNAQFNQMRMHGHDRPEGGPPPPPPGGDTGFTQEELSSQLDAIGDSDSERSAFISNIVSNFSAADADGNGKVSFSEAQTFNQSSGISSEARAGSSTTTATDSERQVMMQIMRLLQTYRSDTEDATSTLRSSLSVSA